MTASDRPCTNTNTTLASRGPSTQDPRVHGKSETRTAMDCRVCHRRWTRGERAPGPRQIGYQWAYIFTAVRPATGEDFTLALPA